MITKDMLLEIACEADKIMEAEKLPAGTLQTEAWRNAMRKREAALTAARWLEEGGLTEREQIGPFGSKDIKAGDKVRIKAGTVINSMNPKHDRDNPKIARRPYVITVYRVDAGSLNSHWHSHQHAWAVRDQQVCWAGEGGYWCYASTSDVEVV